MPHNFHIYKSSAGSGKTYTLVKEYLKIVLLHPTKVKNILAITFTNAAAAEMKERIIRELGQISQFKGHDMMQAASYPMIKQVISELKEDHAILLEPQTIVDHASLVLKTILHAYADFSVSTIDAFVHRVIRTFSFDLFLPFHFDVELDDEALLSKAADLLISRAGQDHALTTLLVAFITRQADEEKELRIDKLITDLGATLMEEDVGDHLARLQELTLKDFIGLSHQIKQAIHQIETEITRVAAKATTLIEQHQLEEKHFYQSRSNICTWFNNLSAGLIRQALIPNSYVKKTIEEDKWTSGKAGQYEKDAINSIKPVLRGYYQDITGDNQENLSRYKTLLAIYKHFFQVAVLHELNQVLREIKADQVVLHISDFNRMIAAIVNEQPVPFIYERLGERYQHYMIDEFQDTSGLQWQNLLPLVDNALATGHQSLVVGDGKQAIYRFRNGDVEQFARLPELTNAIRSVARPEWEQSLKANARIMNLATNYRSQKEIVGFNNRFFDFMAGKLADNLQPIYHEAGQGYLSSKPGGYVELMFLSPDHDPDQSNQLFDDEVDHHLGPYELQTLTSVSMAIEKALQTGHAYRDITILCHSNAKASLVSRYLLEAGTPVVSSESLLLNQSEHVNFILSVLQLYADPYDQVAAAETMAYLHKHAWIRTPAGISDSLDQIRVATEGKMNKDNNAAEVIEKLLQRDQIPFSFNDFDHLGLYDMCEHMIRMFFTRQEKPNPFVAFFSDVIFEYSESQFSSVLDFLSWWKENSGKYSLVLPDGLDAVRVMTIHKSKGLQFPVVIIPFADHRFTKSTKKGQWVDVDIPDIPALRMSWVGFNKKDLEHTPFEKDQLTEASKSFLDALNMVYVAFTRPADKLFVISKKPGKPGQLSTNGFLHAFLLEENKWSDDQLIYSYGNADPLVKKTTHQEERPSDQESMADELMAEQPLSFSAIISQPWSRALRMKSHQIERSPLADAPAKLTRGNLLHRAMEKIHTPEDISKVLGELLKQGEIDMERLEEWDAKIRQLIHDEQIVDYFKAGLTTKSEAGIFDEDGRFYRPDRIVITNKETVVMDYKTGKPYAAHAEQMDVYAGLLGRMGYQNIKKLLLYLDQGYIKTV